MSYIKAQLECILNPQQNKMTCKIMTKMKCILNFYKIDQTLFDFLFHGIHNISIDSIFNFQFTSISRLILGQLLTLSFPCKMTKINEAVNVVDRLQEAESSIKEKLNKA